MKLLLGSMILALAACTAPVAQTGPVVSPPPVTGGVAAQADTVILSAERAFAVAELAYITAADGVGRLVDEGVIGAPMAVRVRALNAEARVWLERGKAAGDAAEKARDAAELLGIADKLDALRSR